MLPRVYGLLELGATPPKPLAIAREADDGTAAPVQRGLHPPSTRRQTACRVSPWASLSWP